MVNPEGPDGQGRRHIHSLQRKNGVPSSKYRYLGLCPALTHGFPGGGTVKIEQFLKASERRKVLK